MMRVALMILIVMHVAAAALSVLYFDAYPIWIIGAVATSLFIYLVTRRFGRIVGSVMSAICGLGIVMLMTSLHLQGEGFNGRYFYHFNLESLKIGLAAYPELIIGASAFVGLSAALPWFFGRKNRNRPTLTVIATATVVALTFPPFISIVDYAVTETIRSQNDVRISRTSQIFTPAPMTSPPKNLILIYAESLEQTYFDDALFPDLLPRLSKLREDALNFTNVSQVDGTGWTIAGLVASQCSLPFNVRYWDGQEAHTALAAIEAPFERELCMGDILDGYGYDNTYMGGAKLSFAGKGKFLRANGFDTVLGQDALLDMLGDYEYRSGWGLYDDSLLDLAAARVPQLAAGDAPFMLSVLTVDTHQPNGHISKDCAPYPNEDNPILHAVYCTDQVIGEFIETLRARPDMDNTVIALFSDHLALRNTVFDRLSAIGENRRLTFSVWGDDIAPGENTARATHFDVGPTLMELIGIPNYRENNFGRSVLDGQDGAWFDISATGKNAVGEIGYLDMGDNNAGQGVKFNSTAQTITIGDKVFTASRAGFDLGDSAIFMMLVKSDGTLDAVLFADDMDAFGRIADDQLVIAVSKNPALATLGTRRDIDRLTDPKADAPTPEASGADTPFYYYIGSPSRGVAESGRLSGETYFKPRYMRKKLKMGRKP